MLTVDLFQAAPALRSAFILQRRPRAIGRPAAGSQADWALQTGHRLLGSVLWGMWREYLTLRGSLDWACMLNLAWFLYVCLCGAMHVKPRDTRLCTASSTCRSCVTVASSFTTLLLFRWGALCFVCDRGANKQFDLMCRESSAPAANLLSHTNLVDLISPESLGELDACL